MKCINCFEQATRFCNECNAGYCGIHAKYHDDLASEDAQTILIEEDKVYDCKEILS